MSNLKNIQHLEITPPAGVWINIARELDEMNENKSLSAKLNNIEAEPPSAVWNNIAKQLDELKEQEPLSAKINNIEVQPPSLVWDNISNQLDEMNEFENLAEKLNHLEATPPPMAWNNIAASLDEEQQEKNLSEKLYALEIEAPATAWNNISKELDDQHALEVIERKLSGLQVNPPAAAWGNIKKELDRKKNNPSLVVPMHHRSHGWLKYAAAACFIAIISITAFFILNDGGSSPAYTATTNGTANNVQQSIPVTPPQGSAQQTLAGIRTKLGNAYTASAEKNIDMQNRYIILMTQDGNIVRMSKKVGNLADCIAGEDNSCDDQISTWQKEMANSDVASSPDNFLDILDIVSEKTDEADKVNL